ncbi:hypothetical protein VTL71DRAFT_14741 [Oculimacula yallundae]|uniref:Uncharacterized protein n=1 Tax=Oculimacula yallundae TaxID=86028 RepID=A0ABR4CJC4_9HELO
MDTYPSSTCATNGSSEPFISDSIRTSDHSGPSQDRGLTELPESKEIPMIVQPLLLNQPTGAPGPLTYSIDRFKSDPTSSQPRFCFTSPDQSLSTSVIRASTVIAQFSESFSVKDDSSVEKQVEICLDAKLEMITILDYLS